MAALFFMPSVISGTWRLVSVDRLFQVRLGHVLKGLQLLQEPSRLQPNGTVPVSGKGGPVAAEPKVRFRSPG